MKKLLKRSLSVFLAITMIFSSAYVGLNEVDFSGVFAVKAEAATTLFWPLKSNYTYASSVTSPYGYRTNPINGTQELHNGMDLSGYGIGGTPIYAAAAGRVQFAGMVESYGNLTVIWHDDLKVYTFYAHAKSIAVSTGDTVSAGDVIAYVGSTGDSTGDHLHFGICEWVSNAIWPGGFKDPTPGNGYNYTTELNVAPTGITASEKQFTMTVGESKTVTATVEPSNANNKNVTWASSNTNVATVSNGVIKAVSSGGATITATNAAGHKAYVEVVINPVNVIADGMIEYDGHTYEIFHSLMTWKQAKEYCEKQGGHLATITSKEENDAVGELIEKYSDENYEEYFIGMTDEDSADNYLWITGEEFGYENWDAGEPSNAFFVLVHERYQNYGAILKDGSWDDVNNYANVCAPVFGFICEYEKDFTYNNVTIINDKVYELYEREYPITFANEFAINKGGNLVSITSEQEQIALIAWIQANSDIEQISIGANDVDTEGIWQWSNGEVWSYAPWDDGEPNDYYDNEDYATLILDSGKWNDVPGENSFSFVVEYDLDEWIDLGNDINDLVFNQLPEGADPDDYEIVTEYRYRDKETKTSTSSSLDGLTPYDSEITYGSWSSTQTTNSKPTESDTLQITGATTKYKYYHYWNYYGGYDCIDSISYGTNKGYHEIYLTYQLSAVNMADQGGQQAYGSYACGTEGFNFWFYGGTVITYSYQTRSKSTTYYFYKYGDWSDWSTTPVTSTDDREVESRTVYVLKDHKHTFSDWVVETEETCITDGLKSRICTDCGDVEAKVIPATGHQNTIWITEQEPTCTVDGYKDEYCLACGEKVGTEEIPANGHSYSTEWTIDVAPTCTEDGSKSHHCIVCGDKADVTTIASLGHNFKVASTAEEHPHTISYKCSRCTEKKEETSSSADCAVCNFSYTNIDDETCKITGYIGSANSFIIPAEINGRTVTTTTTGAFKNNTTLASVRIENGVQGLGSLAFLGCKALSKIVIPESVTSIGANAFYNCASDFTIYCYRDSYAMQYAIDNSLNYIVMDIGETKNSVIDYKNELIFTLKKCITNILDILYIPENSMAFAEASHISGNNEFLGTGTKITVFENNEISSEYTLIVEGDVNGDSVCDVIDCAQVSRASNGFEELEGAYAMAADSNADDIVDINDYQSMVNKALAS